VLAGAVVLDEPSWAIAAAAWVVVAGGAVLAGRLRRGKEREPQEPLREGDVELVGWPSALYIAGAVVAVGGASVTAFADAGAGGALWALSGAIVLLALWISARR
jgi:hypothetical protein